MQNEYNTPSLAEIFKSPESLQQAADFFVEFCTSQTKSHTVYKKSSNNMNNGIESDEDFLKLLDGCGEKPASFYKKLCETGADD